MARSAAGPGDPRSKVPDAVMRGAAKLDGSAPLLGEEAKRAQAKAEAMAGLRCGGCRRRIGVGLQFTVFEAKIEQGVPTLTTSRLAACSRPDCDHAELCRQTATVVEMVEYVWLDEALDDAAKHQPDLRDAVRERAAETEAPG